MGALRRGRASFRWFPGAALVGLAIAASIGRADGQSSSASPFSSVPTPPKTFPLIGAPAVSDDLSQLVIAASASDAAAVSELLDAQTSPDEVEEYGRTALIYTAMNDNAEIAQTLVNRGATLDIRDKLGKTALHWAAERGSINVLRVLLQAKATVDVQSRQGLTPLMLAASNGLAEAVRLLLKYHADPRKNDYTGRDALSWAANHAAIVQALKLAEAR